LKKIDLTTPYRLDDANAAGLYQDAWDFFETWLQLLFQQLLIDDMTPAEKRGSASATRAWRGRAGGC
jgi:hypothetical protein